MIYWLFFGIYFNLVFFWLDVCLFPTIFFSNSSNLKKKNSRDFCGKKWDDNFLIAMMGILKSTKPYKTQDEVRIG